MNEVLKIEKDVAEAIELFLDEEGRGMKRDIEHTKAVLVAEHYGQDWTKYEDGQYKALNKILTSDLMKCLVNGYEILGNKVVLHKAINGSKEIDSIWFDTEEEAEKTGEEGLKLYGGSNFTVEKSE